MPRGVSALDEAWLQGRLWTPQLIRPSLLFWADAADLSTISIATGVSEWRDKSPFSRHVSQASTALQPTYSPSGFNGRPGIVFDGTRYLFRTSAFCFAAGSISVFTAMRPSASPPATLNFAIAEGLLSQNNPIYGVLNNNAVSPFTTLGFYNRQNLGATINNGLFTNALVNQSRIIGMIDSGSAATGFVDGVSGSAVPYTRVATDVDRFAIGGLLRGGFALPLPCTFNQIVIAAGVVSLDVRFKLEGYLAWTSGVVLDASHPFANRPPLIGD
jgi:hypothetical protein